MLLQYLALAVAICFTIFLVSKKQNGLLSLAFFNTLLADTSVKLTSYLAHIVESGFWWHCSLIAAGGVLLCLVDTVAPADVRFNIATFLHPRSAATVCLVERGIAFVSFVAFLSFFVQLDGLIGSHGLAPAAKLMARQKAMIGWDLLSWRQRSYVMVESPNIFWIFKTSDKVIRFVCMLGFCLSLLILTLGGAWSGNTFPLWGGIVALLWLIIYLCHYSLINVSGDFLGLQSDSNLCEVSCLFLVLALLRVSINEDAEQIQALSGAAVAVLRWLAARKMLGCGLCKWYGSPLWKRLTAMQVHYHTQPLPNPLSRMAHHMPKAWHQAACFGTFLVEILFPVISFLPFAPARLLACSGFVGINIAINLTGNFGFIGALSIVESLSLCDDDCLKLFVKVWFHMLGFTYSSNHSNTDRDILDNTLPHSAFIFNGIVSQCVRLVTCIVLGCYVLATLPPIAQASRYTVDSKILPLAESLYRRGRRYRITNYYAKFGGMHTFRWEIVLEGSNDGKSWLEYGWRYKPWSASARPKFVPLHLPRLDWRIWFLPLGCKRQGSLYTPPKWLYELLRGISRHESDVLNLLLPSANPFPKQAPKYLRTRVVSFDFKPAGDTSTEQWICKDLKDRSQGGRWSVSPLCLFLETNENKIKEV